MERRPAIEYTIGILAIISIILVALESIIDLSRGWLLAINIIDLVICAIFVVDFIYRIQHSKNRLNFLKWHWYEILAMVPAYALFLVGTLPVISTGLRALRLIRIVMLIARTTRLVTIVGKFIQRSRLISLSAITICIIFAAAFVVLLLEKDIATAQITNFSDAVWWSLSTVTTVGYGDIVPNTIAGRIAGMVLMVTGIGIMAAFISQVSATIIESRLQHYIHESDFKMKMKIHVKNSIDSIDKLSDEEMEVLIKTIHSLRQLK